MRYPYAINDYVWGGTPGAEMRTTRYKDFHGIGKDVILNLIEYSKYKKIISK